MPSERRVQTPPVVTRGTSVCLRRAGVARGLFYGVAAYSLWGLFPLYWPLLEPAGALEILAHRVLWSLVTMGVIVVVLRRGRSSDDGAATVGPSCCCTGAAVVISVNWATYIWGVNNGRVVETSLGYFINPLVTVLMGVFILGERLRRTAVGGDGDRGHGGGGADCRLRPAAVGGAGAGVLVRHLRAAQEDRRASTRSRACCSRPC